MKFSGSYVTTNSFKDDINSTSAPRITSNQRIKSHTKNSRINNKSTSDDAHHLNHCPYPPNKTISNINRCLTIDFRYKIHRPTTHSSPRLVSSSKKIFEKESLFRSQNIVQNSLPSVGHLISNFFHF